MERRLVARNLLSLILPLVPVGACLFWQSRLSPYAPAGWYGLAWVLLLTIATAMADAWWPPLVAAGFSLVWLLQGGPFPRGFETMPGPGTLVGLAFTGILAACFALGVGGHWRLHSTPRQWSVGIVLALVLLVAPLTLSA